MNHERWARIKALFTAVSELPPAEREAYLERETASDAELLAEVRSLITSHDSAAEFLEPLSAEHRAEALDATHGTGVGERIGSYRLVEVIGSGGMGDVYKAVRDDDQYRAEVAIKLMRADVRNPLAERRFKSERQILAALDHRNIARLLDGGTTVKGLPYVVMELVVGEAIDRYCEAHTLDTRERVQLFLQVCSAVSYAHQHLVVHRDLKPNNIFVTADGSVKLLDFGIAKLLESESVTDANTEVTRTQLRAMTLEYASPEQVSGGQVTTVSDVYSLGVVLYRLLTGQSPYRAQGNDAARVAEILGDTSPTRPSVVATQDRRAIDSDLDHILLMALRKEPAKRYGSVEQFSADLRNYLGGRPVGARRGTFAYRSRKFVRRHKVPIAAAVLIVLSLVAGLGLALREARIADAERATAQRHFDSVRKLASRLLEFQDDIETLPGATKVRENLMTTSLEYLDALYAERGKDRTLRRDLLEGYATMAKLQGSPYEGSTGDPKAALASFQRAAELGEALYAEDSTDDRVASLLARVYSEQTYLLVVGLGSKDNTREVAQKALKYAQAVRPTEGIDGARDHSERLARAHWAQVMAFGLEGNEREGLAAAARMVAAVEAFSEKHPDDIKGLVSLGAAYNNMGIMTDSSLPYAEALARGAELARKSIAIQERLVALDPSKDSYKWDLADSQFNLANYYLGTGKPAEALAMYDLVAPVMAHRALDRNNSTAQIIALMNAGNRAWALFNLGRVDVAAAELRRIISDIETIPSKNENVQVRFMMAVSRCRLGRILASKGAAASKREARALLQNGIEGLQQIDQIIKLEGSDREELDAGLAALAALDKAAR